MKFKGFIKEYFTFNRRERNAVFVLLSIILILTSYLAFSNYFYSEAKTDFSEFYKQVSQFESQLQHVQDSLAEKSRNFFVYDSTTHKNYERKSLSTDASSKSTFKSNASVARHFSKKIYPLLVELNSADTAELMKLKGIGQVFAKRIVKYRDMLGGFVHKRQLLEVFGFDQNRFNLIVPYILLDSLHIKKININEAEMEDMKSHPYIRWKLAEIIAAYRNVHGRFSSIHTLRKIELINDSIFIKIAPYITVK